MYEGSAIQNQKPEPKKQSPASPASYSGQTGTIYPCCEKAVRQNCVCRASWQCPVHGGWCVGSHD